jgi:hypothetical protein
VSLMRTPITCPRRLASSATAQMKDASFLSTLARNAHWSGQGLNVALTKTELPASRARRWRGSAIRFPKPPLGRVSWLGNRRS